MSQNREILTSLNQSIGFAKMHGLGNDFMVIDQINQPPIELTSDTILKWSDRHLGIGFDQLLIIAPPTTINADFDYIIYNADGNEVEQCGNGARCFAEYVFQKGLSKKNELIVNTRKGVIKLMRVEGGNIKVDMGPPQFKPEALPFMPGSSSKELPHTYSL